jgi:FKBP-type peptidyl-prolyl cis-trans isomerase 2
MLKKQLQKRLRVRVNTSDKLVEEVSMGIVYLELNHYLAGKAGNLNQQLLVEKSPGSLSQL